MRVTVFSSKPYDREFIVAANERHGHELVFLDARLDESTSALAEGADCVCAFVNDSLEGQVLRHLHALGVRLAALRCAGFNNVDLPTARDLGIVVTRVSTYSPHAVAEHTVGLILTLNRKLHKAYGRVRDGNFSLTGLCGFDLYGRTVGIVGTGRIGNVFARIMAGFGCRLVAYDPTPADECLALGVQYQPLESLLGCADIVSLHCPLTPETHHIIDERALGLMKRGVMLINTGRGDLVDTAAIVSALKTGHLGALGLDVYEEEEDLFFQDLSGQVIRDDVFMRLLTFPNVVVTAHQAFFTKDALEQIAETTLSNITAFERGHGELHEVQSPT